MLLKALKKYVSILESSIKFAFKKGDIDFRNINAKTLQF